jgi:hypothetical protein
VLTTHNLANGLRLGTRTAVLARGQFVHVRTSTGPADAESLITLLDRVARE